RVVGDRRPLGGVVHRRRDALEPVQRALDAGRARRAGHAGDGQLESFGHNIDGSIPPMGITARADPLTRTAFQATLHCFTGCAIGEVMGMAIATALGWGNAPTIALSVVLAFIFGYALTMRGLLAGGMAVRPALRIALAADTVSVATMEIVDNLL